MGKRAKMTLEQPFELVVYEILTRLPVKTLTRFRCVSKSWNSSISNPRFQKEHLQHSQQTPLLLLTEEKEYHTTVVSFATYSCDGGSLLKRFSKDFPKTDEFRARVTLIPLQSCLGLVCLMSSWYGHIFVLNPSTEEIITLPPRICQDDDICLGFGYSAPTEEFKVVRFFTDNNDEGCFCEVFTLATGDGWREARCPPPFRPSMCSCPPLLHGALHLLPSEEENGYIAAFDLKTEEYSQVSLPKNYFKKKSMADGTGLAEARGSLCMTFDFFKTKGMLQLWFLKDYPTGKWVKAYNINLGAKCMYGTSIAITADGYIFLSRLHSISINEDTNIVKAHTDLCFYNIKEKSIVKKFGSDCSGLFFIESFFSLGSR